MKYILSNKISSSGLSFTSFRNSIKTIDQISIHSVFMKKKWKNLLYMLHICFSRKATLAK